LLVVNGVFGVVARLSAPPRREPYGDVSRRTPGSTSTAHLSPRCAAARERVLDISDIEAEPPDHGRRILPTAPDERRELSAAGPPPTDVGLAEQAVARPTGFTLGYTIL